MSLLEAALLVIGIGSVLRGLTLRVLASRLGEVPGREGIADSELPSLSLVVAGRNEERDIEKAVLSWLALDLPELEVIVIDDRSDDATPQILTRLAAEHPRLIHLRIDERPEDWLGKCWALQQGAERATGDWILFTDADVVFDKRALRRVLVHAQAEGIDHLALLPQIHAEGFAQKALTWLFFQLFLTLLGGLGANKDSGRGCIGVGAFGLVRRSAYEAVGRHEEIRMQVGDDVALARLLVRSGYRQRAHWGLDVAELEWHPGLWATVKGLEKNSFWGLRFSLPLLLLATAGGLVSLSPLVAPLIGTPTAWTAFGLWCCGLALAYRFPGATLLERTAAILLHPFSVLLLTVTGWNSALHAWRNRGIVWRGDHIPIELLRAQLKPIKWWTERIPPRDAA